MKKMKYETMLKAVMAYRKENDEHPAAILCNISAQCPSRVHSTPVIKLATYPSEKISVIGSEQLANIVDEGSIALLKVQEAEEEDTR